MALLGGSGVIWVGAQLQAHWGTLGSWVCLCPPLPGPQEGAEVTTGTPPPGQLPRHTKGTPCTLGLVCSPCWTQPRGSCVCTYFLCHLRRSRPGMKGRVTSREPGITFWD